MTANSGSAGRGKSIYKLSKNLCPYCGKRKWQMYGCYFDEWIEENIEQQAIVDWGDFEFESSFFGSVSVDICLSCGAQVQG